MVALRQVGMLAADGRSAQWTGGDCIPAAGNARGENWIAQANMVASPRVWEAMGEAFDGATGSLPERLMTALEAAEAEGGDWRGRGGAACSSSRTRASRGSASSTCASRRATARWSSCGGCSTRALGYRAANRATNERAELGARYGLPGAHVQQLAIQDALALGNLARRKRLYAALARRAAAVARRDPRCSRRSRISRATRHSSTNRIERVPKALYFTDDPAACELLGSDPFAMLIGFAIDQQVTVQKAFAGRTCSRSASGTLDPKRLAKLDLTEAFTTKPAIHRFPGAMATRVRELAASSPRSTAATPRGSGRRPPTPPT